MLSIVPENGEENCHLIGKGGPTSVPCRISSILHNRVVSAILWGYPLSPKHELKLTGMSKLTS